MCVLFLYCTHCLENWLLQFPNMSGAFFHEIKYSSTSSFWQPDMIFLILKWKSLSCVRLFVTPWTGNSPGRNTGVGSISLLQGTFPTQESNPGLPHCRWILYQLSHKGSPFIFEWVDHHLPDLLDSKVIPVVNCVCHPYHPSAPQKVRSEDMFRWRKVWSLHGILLANWGFAT